MFDNAGARTREPTRAGRRPLVTRYLCGSLLASGLLYASWTSGPWINPGTNLLDGYVSELAALDQPGSALFRAADVLAGLCAAAAAAPGLLWREGRWATTGWAGLALFGLATIATACMPMDCATFVDSGCAVRELAGTLSLPHQLHALSSSLAGAGALVAMAGLGFAARRSPGIGPAPQWALAWSVVTAAAMLGTLVALMTGSWAGVLQRAQLAGISTWLVALAALRWRART